MKSLAALTLIGLLAVVSAAIVETFIPAKQECSVCELDNQFNAQSNYTCFLVGLNDLTICTCPDGQYTMNVRCRFCDRPNICGAGQNVHCVETPTGSSPGYVCICPNNQFVFNRPCPEETTTAPPPNTTALPIGISNDNFTTRRQSYELTITESGQVAERAHSHFYNYGAAAFGMVRRAVGVHHVRIYIERMYLNRELFIGIQSVNDIISYSTSYKDREDTIGPYPNGDGAQRASGWFGNHSIAIFGQRYSDGSRPSAYPNGVYEQFYGTNDIVTLIINCEDATLTLRNERTAKEYRMSVDHGQNTYGKLPWVLHVNLFYPGDKVRLLSS